MSYNKLWESEFDGIVSKRDKLQDDNISQIKLKINEANKTDEKTTTTFEAVNHEDVINKAYQDEKLKKIDGRISYIKKNYNEFKKHYNK